MKVTKKLGANSSKYFNSKARFCVFWKRKVMDSDLINK